MYVHHALNFHNSKTLLDTAQVLIKSAVGQVVKLRSLVDPGSDDCLISRTEVELLQLPLQKCNTNVKAIGETTVGKSNHLISCNVTSIHNPNATLSIDAVVMSQNHLSKTHPPSILHTASWPHLKNLQLADPEYFRPSHIDLILGVDTYSELFFPDIRKGFVLLGKLGNVPVASSSIPLGINSDDQLRKFWELEEVADIKRLTKE